ncbi:MAG: DEAD/DEAH box helicase [Chitinophagales bacterium]|jgi:ATP-dependent RNA helicase DeaD|nr:DEAD/DEAH box helicase [Bacteroidota bacterium]MBK9554966.1 DEAD/DEAH box helicase [Bacteroidota bacterium]MBL0281429.1 DEAD/DEAH box helicase [Bacteroidota bacterium]MBP9880593.1 DEAD/DEAH box helicase [Chitinophagales bacterium]
MKNFSELGLSEAVAIAIAELGFEKPTPIQSQVIPAMLESAKDLIALAQTGTGKTAAFGIPLVELIDTSAKKPQALVLAPTRELCVQIENDLKAFSAKTKHFYTVAVYGGANIRTQIDQLRKGVQVVVATPGRLIDLLGRRAVDLSQIKYLVLDEADEMLNMGFQEDIDEILSTTPKEKVTWLFSATMPTEIKSISKKYMKSPMEISAGNVNQTNANIEHQYYLVQPKNKYAALKRILDYNPDIYGIIFCRTKAETQEIAEKLIKDGYNADSLHGDLSQMQRDKVMLAFRERTLQMLIATDVAARGIDIDNLTHIINLHLPDDMDFYTHRSGRTARAGKTGISLVLISEKDLYKIKHLERKLQMQFKKMTVPSGIEVCEKQLLNMIHRVHEVEVNEAEIAKYLPVIEKEFADMTKEDVLKKFASLEFNRFLEYYRFAEDLNIGERREVREYATKKGNNDLMFINLGKMDNLGAKELVEMVKQVGNVRPHDIGDIRLKGAYSFFELPANQSQRVVQAFNGFVYRGRRVRVEIQNERQEFPKKKAHKGGSREMKPYKGKRK